MPSAPPDTALTNAVDSKNGFPMRPSCRSRLSTSVVQRAPWLPPPLAAMTTMTGYSAAGRRLFQLSITSIGVNAAGIDAGAAFPSFAKP